MASLATSIRKARTCCLFTEFMLPLRTRGLVASNADQYGRVWYRLTPQGAQVTADQGSDELLLGRYPNRPMRNQYLRLAEGALHRLEGCRLRNEREIGLVPMPEGV